MGVRHHLRVITGRGSVTPTPDAAYLEEYGGWPEPSPRCAAGDGSCGHRSISDCHASRIGLGEDADQRFVERLLRYVGPSEPEITEAELRLLDGNR